MINRLNRVCGALLAAASVALLPLPAQASDNERDDRRGKPAHYDDDGRKGQDESIQVGQRPLYLVDGMDDGPLKRRLLQCKDGPFRKTDFSIGHRGAALQFPEHTQESYVAAARQGAGIVECDVTFTKDGKLVCRHAENDLHTTTNILSTPLAGTCIKPFTPAMIDASGKVVMAASAECRTSTLSLDEFKSLRGKMDASNPAARSVAEYQGGTASWRTDLYTGRGTLLSFRESIELNQALDVKHTPELKGGDADTIKQVFGSQENYALAFAAELRAARVKPRDVWPQSFNVEDVLTWIGKTEYGRQAVYLLDYNATDPVNDIVIQPPDGPLRLLPDAQAARRQDHRAADPGAAGGQCQRARRAVATSERPEVDGLRHHHVDDRALGPAQGRRGHRGQPHVLLRLRPEQRRDQEGQRPVHGARRAGARREDPRHLLRLAGHGDLLRQLHGAEVGSRGGAWPPSTPRAAPRR